MHPIAPIVIIALHRSNQGRVASGAGFGKKADCGIISFKFDQTMKPMFKLPALALPAALPQPLSPRELAAGLPRLLARQSSRVPFGLQRSLLLRVMAQAFREPLEDGDFEFLEGKWLQVEISDLNLRWFFSCGEDGRLMVSRDEQADASIRGNIKEFLLLASRSEDPDTLFFQRRLMIEGDTEIGLEVKNLMDGVDHDSLPPLLKLILTRGAGLANRLL